MFWGGNIHFWQFFLIVRPLLQNEISSVVSYKITDQTCHTAQSMKIWHPINVPAYNNYTLGINVGSNMCAATFVKFFTCCDHICPARIET